MEPTDAVHMAVLAIADKPGGVDLALVQIVVDRATTSGHRVVARATSLENETAIREQLARWTARDDIDVVIAIGGFASNAASKALAPLVTETLPGFTDLFRWLAYQDLGPGAMLSDAEAARCDSCFVFLLPPSVEAVRNALDKLVLPQLDRRTKPRNLVMLMPRLQNLPPTRAEPPRATANVIKRKATDDPPTKPIELAKLERQIALSTAATHDSPTRKIDIGGVLPRLPPGADESAELEDRDTDSIIILPKRSQKPKSVEPAAAAPPPVRPATPTPAAPPVVVESAVARPTPQPVRPAAPVPMIAESARSTPQPVRPAAPTPAAPPPRVESAPPQPPFVESPPSRQPTDIITPPPPPKPTVAPSRRPAPPTERVIPDRRRGPGRGTKLLVGLAALGIAAAAGFVIATRFVGGESTAKPATPPEPVATATSAAAPAPAADAATIATAEVDARPSSDDIELAPPAGSAKPAKPAKATARPARPATATTPAAAAADATPAEPADAAPASPAAECDEAACAAAHNEPTCCERFKPAETAAATPGLPETLERPMVKTAIERIKPIVIQCGEKVDTKGTVKLAVTVSADGVVQDVSVAESPDASLGECVASAMRKAKFGKTANGGSFTYPFVF